MENQITVSPIYALICLIFSVTILIIGFLLGRRAIKTQNRQIDDAIAAYTKHIIEKRPYTFPKNVWQCVDCNKIFDDLPEHECECGGTLVRPIPDPRKKDGE